MGVQYRNRKGDTYYLHEGQSRGGKVRYIFSRKTDGKPVESIPDGFEIYEKRAFSS